MTNGQLLDAVLSGEGNVVLAVIRLEQLQQKNLFTIGKQGLDGEPSNWQVMFPTWWPYQQEQEREVCPTPFVPRLHMVHVVTFVVSLVDHLNMA